VALGVGSFVAGVENSAVLAPTAFGTEESQVQILSPTNGADGFEPPTTWFEEAYSNRRTSLENKEFRHLGCATEPPVTLNKPLK
jgi:hypothetical protein